MSRKFTYRHIAVALSAFVVASLAAAQSSPQQPAQERKKRLLVSRVVSDLAAEAQSSWDRDRNWPRTQPDAAAALTQYEVLESDVLASLGKPLHRNAAMDGYLKWQLLSFDPDFTTINEGTARRIIEAMPNVIRQVAPPPPPSEDDLRGGPTMMVGSQTAYVIGQRAVPGTRLFRPVLGVVRAGAFIDAQGYVSVNPHQKKFSAISAVEQLHIEQDTIAVANNPALAYRDRIIDALPREGGFKFLAMLKDVHARLKAGDPSTAAAIAGLMEESRTLSKDLALSRATYRQIQAATQLLQRERTKILKEMTVTDDGDHDLTVIEMFFPRNIWDILNKRVDDQGQFVPR